MYLYGEEIEDERLDAALNDLRPLPGSKTEANEAENSSTAVNRIREIVRQEIASQQ